MLESAPGARSICRPRCRDKAPLRGPTRVLRRRTARREVAGKVSVVIKTFQRPLTVNASIASIRRFYSSVPVIVADDSREPVRFADRSIIVHRMPFDSGVSRGRNFLVSQVRTTYLLMCDDDHVFTRHTKLERMIDRLEGGGFDILGCLVLEQIPEPGEPARRELRMNDFQMDLELGAGTLRFVEPNVKDARRSIRCDLVHQFFLARTEAIRATGGWDDRLKTADHTDFFLRMKNAGLKVGFTPTVAVMHESVESERRSAAYAPYRRDRLPEFRRIWIESHGIERLIGRNGSTMDADDFIRGRKSIGKLGNQVFRPAPARFVD